MRAFLKRRWFLLMCAVVLLAGTGIDVSRRTVGAGTYEYGVVDGCLSYYSMSSSMMLGSAVPEKGSWVTVEFHAPRLGHFKYDHMPNVMVWLNVPLWLPLAMVLGWLALSELKWRREKRAFAAEAV
jgi:hypothetical protein